LVMALRYKPEGCVFNLPIGPLELFIDLVLPALQSIQRLTVIITRGTPWWIKVAGT
jgi:hypothetical protein